MKKIMYFAVVFVALFITSCSNGLSNSDELITSVVKIEQKHLNNYNRIKRETSDTVVINTIDSLKHVFLINAHEIKGLLEGKRGIIYGDLELSLNEVNKYIDSLK